ncbi:deoxyribose-phosphate aldolase [Acidicapsa ligni]|uniref:deoxyribose-phosphate aldolase n=1 Tax=Acidicapsa ligni TaxID=542300 RepID=UPI0021DF738A|nr:deoxyribose-phosphate aldolase [Acidicapsa ligni]
MSTLTQMTDPLVRDIDLDFDNGYFDAAGFAAEALSGPLPLAAVIDHTLLKPEATRTQVENLCDEAIRYRFACAMVNPVWVSTAASLLAGTGVPVGVVIGFPLGATLASTLRHEAASLARLGAKELDMVISIGQLKSGEHAAVERTIRGVAEVVHDHGALLKVILETCLLSVEEKLRASEIAIQAGTDFLKTSTGFSTGGATAADVALLRGVAGARSGVKASGGIRTLADVRTMLEAGANRIGASASVAIVRELGAE